MDDHTVEVMNRIDQIHTDNPTYGYRKITDVLRRDTLINKKAVQRLMREMGDPGNLPETQSQQALPRPVCPTLSVEKPGHYEAESGVGNRYYLHQNAQRIHVSVCHSRRVQPLCG